MCLHCQHIFRIDCYSLDFQQAHAHTRELYKHISRRHLEFGNRLQQMAAEVQHLMPDILALQEVDHMRDFDQSLAVLG